MTMPDAIVVGSGPAGVSATWPLLEAGWRVHMLEAGALDEAPHPIESWAKLRHSPHQWRHLLGDNLRGLADCGALDSPKFRTANAQAISRDYAQINSVEAQNFHLFGACAPGGLSNIWGAIAAPFTDDEISTLHVDAEELAASYRRVAKRVGLSGASEDDLTTPVETGIEMGPPLPLHPTTQQLLESYHRHFHSRRPGEFRLGRPRHAVLTEGLSSKRMSCNGCGACLWGCDRGAIYSSRHDLARLRESPQFSFQGGFGVRAIERHNDLWRAIDISGRIAEAPILILAAGVLATTRLVLALLGHFDRPVPLLSNPVFAMALLVPRRLLSSSAGPGFAMAQLAYRLALNDGSGEWATGAVYTPDGLPISELSRFSVLTRPAAVSVLRALKPGLLLGTCFFPGRLSRNHARLEQRAGGPTLVVTGAHAPELPSLAARVRRRLARFLRPLGAYIVPSATLLAPPGADLHYAGTLAMGKTTTPDGEVRGARGLFVMDASTLTQLPATHCTFTAMANADRAMRRLAATGQPGCQ